MGLTASVRPDSLLNVWTDYSRALRASRPPLPNQSACICHVFVREQVLLVLLRIVCDLFHFVVCCV